MPDFRKICDPIKSWVSKQKELRKEAMGSRFLITGIQLGMIEAELNIIKKSLGDDSLNPIIKEIKNVHEHQYIGESENQIEDDVSDMRNLFASWCSNQPKNEQFDYYFTLYWKDGQRDVVKGKDLKDAMTHAGYGAGATSALDFHTTGVDYNYTWDTVERNWVKKEKT